MKCMGIEFTRALNGAMDLATFRNGTLMLESKPGCDYFNNPDGMLCTNTAPVLLSKIDNTKPFTFAARVTPAFLNTYDAGALYIYVNNKQWLKFAFERDEHKRTRIVTVRTIDTSDDNNHDIVNTPSVHLRVSSNTRVMGHFYSLDNNLWQLVRLHRNDYAAELWVGVSAQSPLGNGSTATFEDCTLTESCIRDFREGT